MSKNPATASAVATAFSCTESLDDVHGDRLETLERVVSQLAGYTLLGTLLVVSAIVIF